MISRWYLVGDMPRGRHRQDKLRLSKNKVLIFGHYLSRLAGAVLLFIKLRFILKINELFCMLEKNKLPIYLIFLIVALSSCSIYQPMMTDIPLIHKKGDLRLDGGATLIPALTGTASYGLSEKFSVQAFGNLGVGNYKNDDFYFQAAGGYYKKHPNDLVFEWYNGFGYGEGNTGRHHDPDAYLEGNYQLYFTQINYGKIATGGSNLEYGISFKTGYLHTNMLGTNFWSFQDPGEPAVLYKDENLLFEPVAMIRVGGDHLKISLKMGCSYIHKFTNRGNTLPIDYFNVNFGLNYKL